MYEVGSPCNSGNRGVNVDVKLTIDGEEIEMVPFVNNILANTIIAVVKELNGYTVDSKIEIVLEQLP